MRGTARYYALVQCPLQRRHRGNPPEGAIHSTRKRTTADGRQENHCSRGRDRCARRRPCARDPRRSQRCVRRAGDHAQARLRQGAARSRSSAPKSLRATPTTRRVSTGPSPEPTAPSASPTSGSTCRRNGRARRPRRSRAQRERPDCSMSSGRRSKTRASGFRSMTGGCRHSRANTKCRISTRRARPTAFSPPKRRPLHTFSPRSTGRTSFTSAWGRAKGPTASSSLRFPLAASSFPASRRRTSASAPTECSVAAPAPWASASALRATCCRARRWPRRWDARSSRKFAFQDVPFDVFRGLGFPGADDLGNMFQYQALLGDAFLKTRDPALSRSLDPELLSFDDWLSANAGRIPIG